MEHFMYVKFFLLVLGCIPKAAFVQLQVCIVLADHGQVGPPVPALWPVPYARLWSSVSHPVPPLLRTMSCHGCMSLRGVIISCKYVTLNRVTSYCSGTAQNTTNYALPSMITVRKLVIIRKITVIVKLKTKTLAVQDNFRQSERDRSSS